MLERIRTQLLDRPLIGRMMNQSAVIMMCLVGGKVVGIFAHARAAVLLGPENYGISGVVLGLLPVVILLTNLSMDTVLVREYSSYQSAGRLERVVRHILGFRFFATLAIAAVGVPFLLSRPPYLVCWLLAVPFFLSQSARPYWLLQAEGKLYLHYAGMLVQTLVSAFVILVFFRPGQALGSDLVAYGLGGLAAFAFAWFRIRRTIPLPALGSDTLATVSQTALCAKWIFITGIFSGLYTAAEMPLLAHFRSASEAGTYRVATSLAQNVYTLIAFSNALLYPLLVRWQESGPRFLFRQQLKVLALYAGGAVAVVGFFVLLAPWVFRFLYADEYDAAIGPFCLLILAKAFMLMAGIFSWGMMAARRDRTLLAIIAPISLLAIAAAFLLVPKFGAVASALIAVGHAAAFFILSFAVTWVSSRKQ